VAVLRPDFMALAADPPRGGDPPDRFHITAEHIRVGMKSPCRNANDQLVAPLSGNKKKIPRVIMAGKISPSWTPQSEVQIAHPAHGNCKLDPTLMLGVVDRHRRTICPISQSRGCHRPSLRASFVKSFGGGTRTTGSC